MDRTEFKLSIFVAPFQYFLAGSVYAGDGRWGANIYNALGIYSTLQMFPSFYIYFTAGGWILLICYPAPESNKLRQRTQRLGHYKLMEIDEIRCALEGNFPSKRTKEYL